VEIRTLNDLLDAAAARRRGGVATRDEDIGYDELRRRVLRAAAGLQAAGVDVAVDNTGNPRVIEMAYRLTSPRGRTVLVGVPPQAGMVTIHTLPLHFQKVLTGSHGGESRPEVDIPNYVRLCNAGKLSLADCLGQRYPLAEVQQAIDDMRAGATIGRAILRIATK